MKNILLWLIVFLKLFLHESFGFENLAVRKTAHQSSNYLNNGAYGANLAVDNILSQAWPTAATSFKRDVYWYVDLGGLRNVLNVTIYYRTDSNPPSSSGYKFYSSRFAGFSLYISTKDYKRKGGHDCRVNSTSPPLLYSIPCAAVGQYVTIYNHRDNNQAILELAEVQVFGCSSPNIYGDSCDLSCHSNCFKAWCRANNGSCFSCIDGYKGSLCNQQCSAGSYGNNCSSKCSTNCVYPLKCNHINGSCVGGCKSGWKGELCEHPCDKGEYGANCIYDCGNCKSGLTCDRTTGNCTECMSGYYPPLCDRKCYNGTYGRDCTGECTWNCFNNETCNYVNGSCPNGCADGWRNSTCDTECLTSFYGQQCLLNCSKNCKSGRFCHHITGVCNNGCEDGFHGPMCIEKCSANCRNGSACNSKNGVCDSGCDNGFYGLNCTMLCDCKNNGTCDQVSGSCEGEENNYMYVVPVVVSVCCAVAIMVVVSVVFIVIRRRKPKGKYPKTLDANVFQGQSESTDLHSSSYEYIGVKDGNEYVHQVDLNTDLEDNPECEELDENIYFNVDDKNKYGDIPIENLQTEIENMTKEDNAAFLREYESIPKDEEYPCTAGKKPENTKKNRFISTFPYDHSRIILKTMDQNDSDYINANYIEDLVGKRRYIAAQGPKRNTDVEFWKMVWQETVHKIVMVTNLKEGVKEKCVKYWPDAGGSMTKGEIEIWTENEKTYALYAIRKLKILHKTTKEERDVYHFHYTQWHDHDIPDCLGLVIFQRHVMRTTHPQKNSLTLVHCSAGIGRTGTYIALDALYQYGESKGKVNVPAYVKIMRKDRMSMIQTVGQYITVYKALHIAFMSKDGVIPREKFHEHVEAQNDSDKPANTIHFRTGFNELKSMKPHYSQKEYKDGNENIDANFTKTVLPVDKFRCKLSSNSKGRGHYYNAVFIQSYTKRDGLICAQFPLIPQAENFLRLVYEFDSCIVVSVKCLSEVESTKIWMPSKGSSLTVGDFTVSLDSTSETRGSVKTTLLSLNKMGCDARVIHVFETKSWSTKHTRPSDLACVLDLVAQVQNVYNSKPDSVITVLSRDGATKCGVFCTVFNALQQVQMDNEVDIFTIARQMQIRRPEMFSSMDEYQFCFKAVDMYLRYHPADKDDLYVNSEDWYTDVL